MTIGKTCVREVERVAPKESIRSAARRMRLHRVGSLLVVEKPHKPMGIVTDRDLAVRSDRLGKEPGPDDSRRNHVPSA